MARRVITHLVSDLSGAEIADGAGETVAFSYRGSSYEIDLTSKEAAAFDKAIATYVENATKTSRRRSSSRAASTNGYDAKVVRAWARDSGIDVPERGRIPLAVVEQYRTAGSN